MAQLLDSVFGKISGRLGDYVFKQINGKTFVYYRPKNDDTSYNVSSKTLIKRFLKKNNRKQKS